MTDSNEWAFTALGTAWDITLSQAVPEVLQASVLGELDRIDRTQLAELIEDAWRLQAPKRVVAAFDAGPLDRRLDRGGAEVGGADIGQRALHRPHRGARVREDDDVI